MFEFVKNRKLAAALVGCALGASMASAPVPAQEPITPKLTPRLHQLLQDEMKSVKQAMEQVFNAMIVGDHAIVASTAEQIHNSFILKQELTEQDKKDLMAAVPEEFVRMDQQFHMDSKQLAHVAKEKKYDLQLFYFGKMVEACQGCHKRFVSDRFPAFSGTGDTGGHGH